MKKFLLVVFAVAMIAGVYAKPQRRRQQPPPKPPHNPYQQPCHDCQISAAEINRRREEELMDTIQRGYEQRRRLDDRVKMYLIEKAIKEGRPIPNVYDTPEEKHCEIYPTLINAKDDPVFIQDPDSGPYKDLRAISDVENGVLCSFGDYKIEKIFIPIECFEKFRDGRMVKPTTKVACDHFLLSDRERREGKTCSKCGKSGRSPYKVYGWKLYRIGKFVHEGKEYPAYTLENPTRKKYKFRRK